MADYTEEQRVKQSYPDAIAFWDEGLCAIRVPIPANTYTCLIELHSLHEEDKEFATEAEAWADVSRRLGNEFVDEVGPLAERKEW